MYYTLFFSIVFSLTSTIHSIIVQHGSIQSIKNYIPHDIPKQDVFIVLDLDNTIGMSILDPTFTPWFNKVLIPKKKHPTLSLKDRMNYVLQLKPMEPSTVDFLKELQNQNIPIIILTARTANLHLRTYEQITRIGLDLSTSFTIKNHTIVAPPMLPVTFHHGILLCTKQDKGIVLSNFLKQNCLTPKKVIFVDDVIENAQSVDTAMKILDVDCTAIHYTCKKKYGWTNKIKYSLKTLFGYVI